MLVTRVVALCSLVVASIQASYAMSESVVGEQNNSGKKQLVKAIQQPPTAKKELTAGELLKQAKALKITDKKASKLAEQAHQVATYNNNINDQARSIMFLMQIARAVNNYYLAQLYLANAEPLVDNIKNVALKIELLIELSTIKQNIKKYQAAILHANTAITEAKQLQSYLWQYKSLRQKASVLKSAKRYQESLDIYLQADEFAKQLNYQLKLQSMSELGVIYKYLSQHKIRAKILTEAINYLHKLSDQSELPQFLIHLAQAQRQISEYGDAIRNATSALRLATKAKNLRLSADACVVLSRVYRRVSSYNDALKYSLQAISLHKQRNNNNGIAAAANATGLIYTHLDENDKAVELFQKVLDLPAKEINPKYTAAALREMGKYYFREDKIQQGLTLSKQAFELYKSLKSVKGQASVEKTIGQLYSKLGDVDQAIASFEASMAKSKQIGDKWSVAENLIFLSRVKVINNPTEAKALAEKALQIATDINSKLVIKHAYEALLEIAEIYKNSEDISNYQAKINRISDEIRRDELISKETNKLILSNAFL